MKFICLYPGEASPKTTPSLSKEQLSLTSIRRLWIVWWHDIARDEARPLSEPKGQTFCAWLE
jgi:hypothetical protein